MNTANLRKYKYGNNYTYKYGVEFTDPKYLKTKNKAYYENTKASLINYYKKKYGVEIVEQLIETFGYEIALEKLKNYGSPEPTVSTIKQKKYYDKNKAPLINYYKKKYGDVIASEFISNFGLDEGLKKLRDYKNIINNNCDGNPFQNLLIV